MFLPINSDEFNDAILSSSSSEAVMAHSDNQNEPPKQKLDKKTGLPVWSVEVMYRHANDFNSEVMVVKLLSANDPQIAPGPIRFGGLVFRTWDMGGKRGLSVTAESFTREPKPPGSRAPKPSKPDSKPGV